MPLLSGEICNGMALLDQTIREPDYKPRPSYSKSGGKRCLIASTHKQKRCLNNWRHLLLGNHNPILNRTQKDRELELVYRNEDRDQPYISPVSAKDLTGLPPVLIITGECDPQRDEREAYAERLKQAGNVVTLRRYPGMIHGFFGAAGVLDAGKAVLDQVAQTLQEVAKR
jgi:acetyl esterase/lipase